jgi:hypothetical protein
VNSDCEQRMSSSSAEKVISNRTDEGHFMDSASNQLRCSYRLWVKDIMLVNVK